MFGSRSLVRLWGLVERITTYVTKHDRLFLLLRSGSCCSLRVRGRFWEELFEIFQKVWSRVEKPRYLGVDVLDGL